MKRDGPDPTKLPTAGSPASTEEQKLGTSTGLLSGRDPTPEPQNPTSEPRNPIVEPRDPTVVPRCFESGERSRARGWEMNPPHTHDGQCPGLRGHPPDPVT